ncbi:MAG: transglutaminase-like domain-containing protein, partial [Propionibacteriaceae bacterium]|nr:transglutaminase-like domain-containing protein [Propionibacteriaceae bacterium]
LDVPSTSHTGDLEMLVAALISGISDDYDKLMAIENYLTSSNFTYTLTPSRTSPSDDAVWDFLQRRTGYCVHFATAMVMLGRLAGIPMRVALGFTLPANGNGVVRNLNAHVWPQAHFQNAGWVSFEPTPGGPGTAVPQESMSPSSAQPSTSAPSTSTPTTTASSSSTAAPSTSASTAPGGTAGGGLPWQWILIGVAAAFIVVMAVWGVRAWRIGRATPERAWAAIMRVAQKRQLIDIGATPRAVIDDVGPSLGDDTLARLTALAEEIEKRRYAPPGDAPSKTHPRQWHKAQTSVLRDLKRHQHEA